VGNAVGGATLREAVTQSVERHGQRCFDLASCTQVVGGGGEHRGPQRRRGGLCSGNALLGPFPDTCRLLISSLDRQGSNNTHRMVADLGIQRPVHRGAQIIEIGLEPSPPGQLVRTEQRHTHRVRDLGVMLGVTGPPTVRVAILGETLPGVVAHGLQQPVTGRAVVV